ncbi:MAG: hypothetical protein AAGC44_15760 [Planctomycetota bacterium]
MRHPYRLLKAAALGLVVTCGTLAAPDASAQHHGHDREVYVERNTRGGNIRVQVNRHQPQRYDRVDRYDRRDYDRHDDRRYDQRRYNRGQEVHRPRCSPPPPPLPTGYWKTVYHPPVYRTVYDPCGRARSVMVRRGYTQRVWVAYNTRNRRVY